MSKSIEKEYNHMLDEMIPDLWSRIEPQLHDKNADVCSEAETSFVNRNITENVTGNMTGDTTGNATCENGSNEGFMTAPIRAMAGKKKINWAAWGSIAAAVVLLGIAIPIVLVRNADSNHAASSFHAQSVMNAATTMDVAIAESSEAAPGADASYEAEKGMESAEGNFWAAEDAWENSVVCTEEASEECESEQATAPAEAENIELDSNADKGVSFGNRVWLTEELSVLLPDALYEAVTTADVPMDCFLFAKEISPEEAQRLRAEHAESFAVTGDRVQDSEDGREVACEEKILWEDETDGRFYYIYLAENSSMEGEVLQAFLIYFEREIFSESEALEAVQTIGIEKAN